MPSYSETKDQYILHKKTGLPIGKVYDFVWDEDNGKLLVVLLRRGLFNRLQKILLSKNIVEWSDSIYVDNIDSVVFSKDLVRYKNIFNEYYTLIDTPVYDENNIFVGTLEDYSFDSKLMVLTTISIKGSKKIHHENIIVTFKDIISISEEKIVKIGRASCRERV